jgi:hypothetical protein
MTEMPSDVGARALEARKNPTMIEGIPMYEGCRVRLISMGDDPCPVDAGTLGTVSFIESESLVGMGIYGPEQTAPTVHVRWDDGRSLGLIPGVDKFVRVLRCEWHGCNELFDYREETGRKVDGTAVPIAAAFCSPRCNKAWLDHDKYVEMLDDARWGGDD